MKKFFLFFGNRLKNLDIYGIETRLRIDNNEKFKTIFGSILSLSSFLISFLAFLYFFSQMIYLSNPKMIISIKNAYKPPLVQLNNSNYGFAFGLQNAFTNDQFIDESIYIAEAYQMTGYKNIEGIFAWDVQKLDLETCNIDKFPEDYKFLFRNLPLTSLYCLKNTTFSLFGTILNDETSFLTLKLYQCRNKTIDYDIDIKANRSF